VQGTVRALPEKGDFLTMAAASEQGWTIRVIRAVMVPKQVWYAKLV
jgi:hypothetical protein